MVRAIFRGLARAWRMEWKFWRTSFTRNVRPVHFLPQALSGWPSSTEVGLFRRPFRLRWQHRAFPHGLPRRQFVAMSPAQVEFICSEQDATEQYGADQRIPEEGYAGNVARGQSA